MVTVSNLVTHQSGFLTVGSGDKKARKKAIKRLKKSLEHT